MRFSIDILFMNQGSLVMETKKISQVFEHMESETSMKPMMCTVLQKKCQVPQASPNLDVSCSCIFAAVFLLYGLSSSPRQSVLLHVCGKVHLCKC